MLSTLKRGPRSQRSIEALSVGGVALYFAQLQTFHGHIVTGETCVVGLWAWPGPAHGRQRRWRCNFAACRWSLCASALSQLAAGGRPARELDLPDRFSVGHIVDSEHEWRAHDRACEPQLRLERERGQGGADEAGGGAEKQLEAGAGPGLEGESLVDGALRGGR